MGIVVDAIKAIALTIAAVLGVVCARNVQRGRCPPGWYVNGVSPEGRYRCRPVLGRPQDDVADAKARREIRDDREVADYTVCTGGATPRHDGRRVWCQR